MRIGILGDLHLTNQSPQRRIDNYWETLKGKLSQALGIFDDKNCEIVTQVGDFFDAPTVAKRIESEIIQLFHCFGRDEDRRIFCVFGQHDISGHSKATLPNSPLAVLQAARVVKILSNNPVIVGPEGGDILLYGASFGESVPEPFEDAYNVLVTHRMVGDRPLWPGQELVGPRQFLKKHPKYDLVVCLVGNTKISLLSGEEVNIEDLVGRKEFYVYSYDHYTNSVVPGRASSCKKTKQNVPIVKVTLDNGEVIRCDYDERFLLRNRRYVQAKDLIAGDSLMPLYRKLNDAGYEEVLQFSGKWQKTHRIAYNWKIESQIEFLQSRGLEVNKENWDSNRVCRNTPSFNTALKYVDLNQQFNHKVVSVEFDGYEDVYSFEVDGYHNFALSAGVFVHNCGDYHYRFIETWNGRTIINPGAIVRKTIGKFDLEHRPAVVVFDTDTNESEVIELKFEPPEKVFDLTRDIKKKDNSILRELVNRLKEGDRKLVGWKKILVKVLDERKSSKGVRQVIDETLEEIKTD